MKVKVLVIQSCLTLCEPMDCSPPGSSVHGILQAGILEWVVMPFSRGSSWPRDWTWVSCIAGRFFPVWAAREATSIKVRNISQLCRVTGWNLIKGHMEPPWEYRLLLGAHSVRWSWFYSAQQVGEGSGWLKIKSQPCQLTAEWPETWYLSVSPHTDSGWRRLLPELTLNVSLSYAQHGFCYSSVDFSIFCFGQVVYF